MNTHGYIVRQVIGSASNPDDDRFTLIGESRVGHERAYAFAASRPLTAAEVIGALRTDGASATEAARLLAEARAAFITLLPVLLVVTHSMLEP